MDGISIVRADRSGLSLLDMALRQLAADLGDRYLADPAALNDAVCGGAGSCLALLALRDGQPVGALLASAIFSTMRGGAGLYVSDLWVARQVRGQGLARRLLAAALAEGDRQNAGRFLKLAVYDDNPGARAAYDRLGFQPSLREMNMVLEGPALDRLKGKT